MTNNCNVLVTGANGFIGQHLIKKLKSLDVNVSVLVRDRNKLGFDDVNIFEGDIFNNEILRYAVERADIVFHLVSKTHDFSCSHNSIDDYFKINVEGTRNLLNACIGSNVKHFVYFSSVKAMAEDSKDVLDESFPPNPTTVYGKSKLAAEKIVAEYGERHGFKTTALRLPLVYGPGNKGNIYRMIKAIDRGLFIIIGNGENRRSMVYVENVVDAALAVVDRQEATNEVYIVTDGMDYTVKDLYETIVKELRRKPMPFCMPMNLAKIVSWLGDVAGNFVKKPLPFNSNVLNKLTASYVLSSGKIQKNLGFSPRYNLYNKIDETINWYLEN